MCRILWARWIIQSTLVNCWARSRPLLSKARTNICQSAAYDKYIFRGVTTRATIKPRESGLEKKLARTAYFSPFSAPGRHCPFCAVSNPPRQKAKHRWHASVFPRFERIASHRLVSPISLICLLKWMSLPRVYDTRVEPPASVVKTGWIAWHLHQPRRLQSFFRVRPPLQSPLVRGFSISRHEKK